MRLKIVSLPPKKPFVNQAKALVLGGGCAGVFTALRLKHIGIEDVTLSTQTYFGLSTCTPKVTELHLSGLEYINDIPSAKALIQGGLEFISIFGNNGWKNLVKIGILEPSGTKFIFTQETLIQNKPSKEIILQNLPILEAFYQEQRIIYSKLNLPEQLFTNIDLQMNSPHIQIQSIQPGIAIMRLGALLKEYIYLNGIHLEIGKDILRASISKQDRKWIIDDKEYDIVINATNANYLIINETFKLVTTSREFKTKEIDFVKNHRYQYYVEAEIPLPVPAIFRTPQYTLCTANHTDPESKFLGTMLDRTSWIKQDPTTIKTCLVLYAAGPQNPGKVGGGSWGTTGQKLHTTTWDRSYPDETVQQQITESVKYHYPELQTCKLTPLYLHNGYNLNLEALQGRSDARPFAEPEENNIDPCFISILCLKFTHSAFASRRVTEVLLNAFRNLGKISVKEKEQLERRNLSFELDLSSFLSERDALKEKTIELCLGSIDMPERLAHYFSEPKKSWDL